MAYTHGTARDTPTQISKIFHKYGLFFIKSYYIIASHNIKNELSLIHATNSQLFSYQNTIKWTVKITISLRFLSIRPRYIIEHRLVWNNNHNNGGKDSPSIFHTFCLVSEIFYFNISAEFLTKMIKFLYV